MFADADSRINGGVGLRVIRLPEHYGVLTDSARSAAATARVSHGHGARDGCGQTEEFGEECDGGVTWGVCDWALP